MSLGTRLYVSGVVSSPRVILPMQGSFPSPCGAEASSSLLSEKDLLARLPQGRKVRGDTILWLTYPGHTWEKEKPAVARNQTQGLWCFDLSYDWSDH